MRHLLFTLLLCSATIFTGCSTNPVTGESQLSIISPQQEVAIGEKNYGPYQQQQGGQYSVDNRLTPYVARIGHKLAQLSDNPQLPYEFVVLNNDVPNAWALPGGKIAINRGLLILLEDEAQLAAVLSHEIVHAAARHGAAQMTQATLLNVGAMAAGQLSQGSDYGQLASLAANAGAQAWQARYGRDQELQSDAYGMQYMQRAGYEPQAAVELQETFVKLSQNSKDDFFSTLFASHPPSALRVAENKKRAATMPAGKRNYAAYQNAIKQIKADAPAYKLHTDALALAAKKDFTQAMALTNRAIKLQPNEALFFITQGQLHLQENNSQQANIAFDNAIQKNPSYFLGYLGKGLAEKKLQKYSAAEENLQKSLQILPTQAAAFHLGDISLINNNEQQAIQYFTYAAQGGGELGEQAQNQLSKLQARTNQ